MNRYVYLLLGLCLIVPLICSLLARSDLRSKSIKVGLLGGFAGLAAELFYFRDYWRPPTLSGTGVVSVEDFIFGFCITALSFLTYLYLFREKLGKRVYPRRTWLYTFFFVLGLVSMLFLNVGQHINSIFVSSAIFIVLTVIMLTMRRDLAAVAVYSSSLLTAYLVIIYVILFDVVSPRFWSSYWLLNGTKWDITLLGNVPLTEMLWYFSWILFASISYPFVAGRALTKQK